MADHTLPHFQNDAGVRSIRIGSRQFMCQGASAPFDHPHIFIDMGTENEAVCSYCSTLYRYDANLPAGTSDPAACAVTPKAA